MFIVFVDGGGQPLDDNSKRNPLKALVRIIEKNVERKREAEQAWLEQGKAMNLNLKNKVREATEKLNQIEHELFQSQFYEMELLDMIPINDNFVRN